MASGEAVRPVILLVVSQMCLPLISPSYITHFCLFIGDLLFETMEGPQSGTMARECLDAVLRLSQHLLLPGVAFELPFAICFVFPIWEPRVRRAGKNA